MQEETYLKEEHWELSKNDWEEFNEVGLKKDEDGGLGINMHFLIVQMLAQVLHFWFQDLHL